MTTLKLAHLRAQGQDMILFPLDSSFGHKTAEAQRSALADLEYRANSAGLRGRAAAVWHDGGQTRFLGPSQWRGFLSSIGLDWVMANVNMQIRF
jgi:hypothetical protein